MRRRKVSIQKLTSNQVNEQIYERFAAIVKEQYPADEAMKITGMLYVAMQESLGGSIPLKDDFTDFDQEAQNVMWTEAFKICNSYADAIEYLRTTPLDEEDIQDGIKQVDKAQKDELFANFLIVARANPKPTNKPQFISEVKKPDGKNALFEKMAHRAIQIEISEKDTTSMKLHIERHINRTAWNKIGFLPERKYVTAHLVKEIPNYREFWAYKNQEPDGSGITLPKPIYLFSEYMDALGHKTGDVFVRQYLFETRMTLDNREELLKELRSTSPN